MVAQHGNCTELGNEYQRCCAPDRKKNVSFGPNKKQISFFDMTSRYVRGSEMTPGTWTQHEGPNRAGEFEETKLMRLNK